MIELVAQSFLDAAGYLGERIGLVMLEPIERMVPAAEVLEAFAAPIGWALVMATILSIVMCITGLARR